MPRGEETCEEGEHESVLPESPKMRQPANAVEPTAVKRKRHKEPGGPIVDSRSTGNDVEAVVGVQTVQSDKPRKKRKDGESSKKKSKDHESKDKSAAVGSCDECGADYGLTGSSADFCKICGYEGGVKAAKPSKRTSEEIFPLFPLENQVSYALHACDGCLRAFLL